MSEYEEFVSQKLLIVPPSGFADVPNLDPSLFPHQRDLVAWALRRGRCAVFADTGLGKTAIQLEWARHVAAAHGDVIILAPLAVAAQTVREGQRMGIEVQECRDGSQVQPGITITNYERLHRFDPSRFAGVVLDESSIIKHHDAKTFGLLVDAFLHTPWRLCATATPAPNDYTELGTHAEFLGICSRQEMLAEYFTHDGGETQKWRLKGHATSAFWRFVASWAALVQMPSDLGYDDGAYVIEPYTMHEHVIALSTEDVLASGRLFAADASSLMERRRARRDTVSKRVSAAAAMVNATRDPWIVWCELNAESAALAAAIPGAVEIVGSQSIEDKERRLRAFAAGETRVLVTKPSIAGFGLNWQHCANVAFVGVTDSWESYYQAVRRCWRFGQTRPVNVHVFSAENEGAVVANLARKEVAAAEMSRELREATAAIIRDEVRGSARDTIIYDPRQRMEAPSWLSSLPSQSTPDTLSTMAIV